MNETRTGTGTRIEEKWDKKRQRTEHRKNMKI